MSNIITVLTTFVLLATLSVGRNQSDTVFATILQPDGRLGGVFEVSTVPYATGVQPAVRFFVGEENVGRDADGQAVSGVAFYAWAVGPLVRIVVFALVPAEGFPNRYLARPGDDPAKMLSATELGRLSMTRGGKVTVEAMKALGLEPLRISIVTEPPPGMAASLR